MAEELQINKIEEPNIFEIEVNGAMRGSIVLDLFNYFQNKDANYRLKLLTKMVEFDGFSSFKSFLAEVAAEKLSVKRLEKHAILCDSRWVKRIIEMEDELSGITDYRFFKLSERELAIDWLKTD